MKKVLLLGAILLMGTQAMADQGTSEKRFGNWTNKLTLTGAMQTNEDFGDVKTDGDGFGNSMELGYGLMYNFTDRYRLGLETAWVSQELKGSIAKDTDDKVDGIKLGITTEYDVYSKDNTTVYLTGSLGGLGGSVERYTSYNVSGEKIDSNKLTLQSYMKLGVGMTYNSMMVETGIQATAYKMEKDAHLTGANPKKQSEDKVMQSSVYLSVGVKL